MDVCPDDELTRAALRAATGDRAALTASFRAAMTRGEPLEDAGWFDVLDEYPDQAV